MNHQSITAETLLLFPAILNESPNGIVAYQPVHDELGTTVDYKSVYFNEAARVLLGYTEADFTQKTLFGRFPEARTLADTYLPMVRRGQPFVHESFFTQAQRWVESRARQLGDGFFLILTDITDRKEAESALIRQNNLLDGLFNTFLSGISVFDAVDNEAGEVIDFRATLVNDGSLRLAGGKSREEILGRTVTELFTHAHEEGMFDQYLAVYKTGQPLRAEHFHPNFGKWIDLSIQKTTNGLLVTYHDISEQKEAKQQLQQSADMLHSVLNGVQSGVASYETLRDETGRIVDFVITSANELACQIMRRPLHQLIGQRMLTLFPGNIETGLFERYATVVSTGVKQQFEQYYDGEGLSVWFDITAVQQGTGLILTFLDISERKQAQVDLAAQTGRLEAIFESSLNGIIAMQAIRDETGQVIDFLMEAANEATLTMTGRTPADLVGTRLLTAFPGNVEAGFLALYQRVIGSGQPERITRYYRDQHKLEAWFEVSAVRQGTERIVVTFSDVTAAQQVQQQLRESNQSLEQFAGVASHDLQEPLRKIQSFGNLLNEQFSEQLGPLGQDLIQRMQNASDRMSVLISDLLTYSRLTSQPETASSLDLTEVVAEVLTDLETRIADKNAVIDVPTLPTIIGSSLAMRQLFQNLISNALKFSRPGVSPRIHLSTERVRSKSVLATLPAPVAPAYWAIRVADNGIGFDARYSEQIFGAFQRLHARNSQYPGTGIGLAIVKKVVEQHHGAIAVHSIVGEGSTFTVYLPAR